MKRMSVYITDKEYDYFLNLYYKTLEYSLEKNKLYISQCKFFRNIINILHNNKI